jgi:hypothetical protein
MSIYKDEQRDERTFWQWLKGLIGYRCQSKLFKHSFRIPNNVQCELRMGHPKRHRSGKYTWGYGDNWLD